MSLRNTCNIDGLVLSPASKSALNAIDSRVNLANKLASALSMSPLLKIFERRATVFQTGQKITKYDWQEFADALHGVNETLRFRVWEEATLMTTRTKGKEYEFWRCVTEVAR